MDKILKEAIKENIENANRQIANLSGNIHFVNELIRKKNALQEKLEEDNA
jgi:hypothetical protein